MKCLIVEDDPILCFTLSECLTHLGHEYMMAHSVAEGTLALKRDKFDVMVLDYNLPDGTSTDLSTLGALTHPNCRIILLTGAVAFPGGEHGHLAPGIDWVLRKPASINDFEALIAYAERDLQHNPTIMQALP